MQIQFPARASIHDSRYRRIYIRIPKSAWIAYQLERLVGKLVRVSIWEPGGEKPISRSRMNQRLLPSAEHSNK